jgi:hypothetical protein
VNIDMSSLPKGASSVKFTDETKNCEALQWTKHR